MPRSIEIEDDGLSCAEAVQEAERLQPDVVIMDLNMPVMSGVEATQEILQRLPKVRVVGLSFDQEGPAIQRMIQAGACGYVCKDAPTDVVYATIRHAVSDRGG